MNPKNDELKNAVFSGFSTFREYSGYGGTVAIAYDTTHYKYTKNIGIPDDGYYNDDVLVIDLVKWREKFLAQKVFKYFEKCCDNLFTIQDAINLSIRDEIAVLPIQYNKLTANFFMMVVSLKKHLILKYTMEKKNMSMV